MSETATIQLTVERLRQMFDSTTVDYHKEAFVNIANDRVRLLAGKQDDVAGTYSDFAETYFDDVDGEIEAFIRVEKIEDWIDIFAERSDETIEMEFEQPDGEPLANNLTVRSIDEEWEISIMLVSSESVAESIPNIPARFNADNEFVNPEGEVAPVYIETFVSELDTIRDAVSLEGDEYHPIVVEDGQLILDIGSESNQTGRKYLQADASGPDIHNLYRGHFEGICKELTGSIKIYTAPDSPAAFIQENNNYTVRHIIGEA